MKQYKGVIFDLDGTLLDTIEDLGDSANEVMREYGCPELDYNQYTQLIGNGVKRLIESCFESSEKGCKLIGQDGFVEVAVNKFIKVYDKIYQNKTKPYQGIPEVLNVLKEKGIKMAVNSNKLDDYLKILVSKCFPDIPFSGAIGDSEAYPKKPDPTAAIKLTELMNLSASEVIYIGDSNVDILTGHNAGMDTMGVAWGFRGEKELRESGADYMAHHPEDICRLF